MAECSFSRCVQERRLIKKELQRWTKNMVVVVGLERVAEELMGRRKWMQCQNVATSCHSRIDGHQSNDDVVDTPTKDWTPVDKCCFCNESTFLDRPPSPCTDQESSSNDSTYRESLPGTPPPPPHSAPTMTAFESVKLAAIAALTHSEDAPPVPPSNMFYPPGHFTPWYLAPTLPPHHPHMAARSRPPEVVPEVAHVEMPLDLSASRQPPPQAPPLHHPGIDNKQIYKAKPRMSAVSGRRTYTEDELQAALRDIQSGKLGTRRAAVIYGIPRSTLRNKVYKLAMERERDAQLLLNAPPVVKVDDEDKELSGAEEEREVEKALRKPLLSMEDLVRFSMLESNGLANSEAIRTLLQQSKVFPQGDMWGGLEHSALGPYISQLLAAKSQQESREQGDYLPKFSPPLLPELVRRMMAEEKMMDEHMKRVSANGMEERTLAADDPSSDAEAASSNVILKIPSFKPTSKNGGNSEPFPSPSQESSSQPFNGDSGSPPSMMGKGIGVSLRDVIAKSISQKFQQGGEIAPIPLSQKLLMSPEVESPYKRSRFSPPLSAHSVIKHNNNNHHMDDRNMQKMSPKSASMMSSNSGSGGKGTRPKRGKYRNYDRDSLVEAVRAVQRGEMSVHRAGSYYGVPHSTLEYKVKERHLMRPRKRDPKPPTDDLKRKDDLRLSLDKPGLGPPKLLKPPYATSPLQNTPNGLKIPPMFDPAMSPLAYSTPPPFPFWRPNPFYSLPMPDFPPGHSAQEQFIASQMIQRLQEESAARIPPLAMHTLPAEPPLGKSARKIAESLYDGTGTNGTFLDGIIRSSLEMGLPSGTAKEGGASERAPENLSNKALLDQLCRNSRITTPVHEGSTSDDDSVKRSSTCGKDDSERNMDFSPSSEESEGRRKLADNADDDFYAKSPKDNFSDNDSPSKDSNDEFSDNEDDRIEDESACDSKHDLQKRDDEVAKDREKQEQEEIKDQTTDTKSNLNS